MRRISKPEQSPKVRIDSGLSLSALPQRFLEDEVSNDELQITMIRLKAPLSRRGLLSEGSWRRFSASASDMSINETVRQSRRIT